MSDHQYAFASSESASTQEPQTVLSDEAYARQIIARLMHDQDALRIFIETLRGAYDQKPGCGI